MLRLDRFLVLSLLATSFGVGGCGLILDTDPPNDSPDGSFDAGVLTDGAVIDAVSVDAVLADGAQPDGMMPDAGDDAGMCRVDEDCGSTPQCQQRCIDERCVEVDENFDGACDCNFDDVGNPLVEAAPGGCGTVSYACQDLVLTETFFPAVEVCDGADNDCDGNVDEGIPTPSCGVGVCAREPACLPLSLGEESCFNLPETDFDDCDGGDEDCDGLIDEDCEIPADFCDREVTPEELSVNLTTDHQTVCIIHNANDSGRCVSRSVELSRPEIATGVHIIGSLYRTRFGLERCADVPVSAFPDERLISRINSGATIRIPGDVTLEDAAFTSQEASPVVHVLPGGDLHVFGGGVLGTSPGQVAIEAEGNVDVNRGRIFGAAGGFVGRRVDLRVNASCEYQRDRTRCILDNYVTSTWGVFSGEGGPAIDMRGGSLVVNDSVVGTRYSTAVSLNEIADVKFYGSQVDVQTQLSGSNLRGAVISGCGQTVIHESLIRTGINSGSAKDAVGIHVRGCETHFVKAVVSGLVNGDVDDFAKGAFCQQSSCTFRESGIIGLFIEASIEEEGQAVAVECDSHCDFLEDSTAVGNFAPRSMSRDAIGILITDEGALLMDHSTSWGGYGHTETHGVAADGADVMIQDSVSIGLASAIEDEELSDPVDRKATGVVVRDGSLAALHATLAGRGVPAHDVGGSFLSADMLCDGAFIREGSDATIISSALIGGACHGDYAAGVFDSEPIMSHVVLMGAYYRSDAGSGGPIDPTTRPFHEELLVSPSAPTMLSMPDFRTGGYTPTTRRWCGAAHPGGETETDRLGNPRTGLCIGALEP